jgi:hypothetical protein
MLRDFANALRELRRVFGEAGGSYRPDLHYMRGPGPKWHAKYGNLVAVSAPAERPAAKAIGKLAQRRV